MNIRSLVVLFVLLLFVFLLDSFTQENPYFHISQKDVELTVPKKFPKPVYDFRNNKITPEIFILGRYLFYDPVLSRDSFTSCSFCHQRIAAFAHIDHPLSHGVNGLIGTRNVPALQNLAWNNDFMLDGRVNNLEVQPLSPMTNEREMGETLENVLLKLRRSALYPGLFKNAYHDTAITSERMLKAIAQFVGLMVSADSKYDRCINGKEKFTSAEQHGLELFRAHCESCHKEPLFTDHSFRNIGLRPDTALKDSGRAAITGNPADFMKFRVPSLRNVEMTYPYMHDGRFRNLEQVMDHYANGNFFTDGVDLNVVRNVGFTGAEKTDIIAFLKTLTDQTFLHDRRFADPFFQ